MPKLTEQQIEDLKPLNGGKIFELELPKDDEGKEFAYAYLKKPDRSVISVAMAKSMTDPVGGADVILRSCIIPAVSDMEVLSNDELFLSAVPLVMQLVEIRKGTLKKN